MSNTATTGKTNGAPGAETAASRQFEALLASTPEIQRPVTPNTWQKEEEEETSVRMKVVRAQSPDLSLDVCYFFKLYFRHFRFTMN